MELRRRIGAYAVCRDDEGRVLLIRASSQATRPGTWFLPGGGIRHGEHPADAVVRQLAEETGLAVEVVRVRDVAAEVIVDPAGQEHTDGVVYDVLSTGGGLRHEPDETSGLARWVTSAEAARLPLSRFAAEALELAPPPTSPLAAAAPPAAPPGPRPRRGKGQRFAAYGFVTDPAGRVLLTLNAQGYPGAGLWHAPGGGTEFGEQPRDGLHREILEETGQRGQIGDLVAVTHSHNPAALGPEGYPIDWHAVRAVFEVKVDEPTAPRVIEAGGSTADAGWFTRKQAAALPLTDVASVLLGLPPAAERALRGRGIR